jgi:ubiquinone/menaquinone biosynthesis C-methylase UbiE
MKHHDQVADAFGSTAAAYLTSQVHASGADLDKLVATFAATCGNATVLDMGCGAGHASFAVAPHVKEVVAYDIAPQMLATVEAAAKERGLSSVRTQQGAAETLPFDDARFDWAISRMSAHHSSRAGGSGSSISPVSTIRFTTRISRRWKCCATLRIFATIAPTNGSRCSTAQGSMRR